MAFSSLNQHFDNHMCYWLELFSPVSDVAHGSLVIILLCPYHWINKNKNYIYIIYISSEMLDWKHVLFNLYAHTVAVMWLHLSKKNNPIA